MDEVIIGVQAGQKYEKFVELQTETELTSPVHFHKSLRRTGNCSWTAASVALAYVIVLHQ
jgi:hypothetical protein